MAHHKRKKRRAARAGCKLCKPHKAQGNRFAARTVQERRERQRDRYGRVG